jgi:hypothetical protein
MGICASSKRVEQEEECDENVVYVMDEQGGGGGPGEEDAPAAAAACRKVASLFSQKGKKGPNQDAVILCQVRYRSSSSPRYSSTSSPPRSQLCVAPLFLSSCGLLLEVLGPHGAIKLPLLPQYQGVKENQILLCTYSNGSKKEKEKQLLLSENKLVHLRPCSEIRILGGSVFLAPRGFKFQLLTFFP